MVLFLPILSIWQSIIHLLETHQQPCKMKKNWGMDCLGCGFQRALIDLMKGNLLKSIKEYPALIPIIFLFLFLILHIIFKFKNGAKILVWNFIFIWIIMITNYILKFIN